ncbi:unnamed protein product [Orchesella dallaii]|uniref:Histone deacetylase n=1 Tax=Orchesella dallaii TaxID=48710 RepID=A0ABP1Q3G5_9HEXA
MKDVVYIYDHHLAKSTDNIPHIAGRSRMTHELITAYGLTQFMECKPSKLATREELLKFHSEDYINFLQCAADTVERTCGGSGDDDDEEDASFRSQNSQFSNESTSSMKNFGILSTSLTEESLDDYGLGYDCPVFRNMGEFASRIAGGTIAAAESLVEGAKVAINWCGGWHHAQRSEASGFCYVNDIVVGIHELQKKFKYILYIDLDAHHGDGVENAFAFSDKVMTLSFHHFESGYFPGTGRLEDVGNGRGKFCSLNVPLKAAIIDQQFTVLFDSILNNAIKVFQPEAFVVQCGADCLARDPLGAFNLTEGGIVRCLHTILSCSNIPTLLLGGGGYNIANASRLWTSLTAAVLNKILTNEIPDNKYFLRYGPDFELCIQPSLRKDENDLEYINDVIIKILGYLTTLKKRKEKVSSNVQS